MTQENTPDDQSGPSGKTETGVTRAAALAQPRNGAFRLDRWLIEPSIGRISRDEVNHNIEPKTMDVLVELAEARGAVVSTQELIDRVWLARPMGDNPVHRCISHLRKSLGDQAAQPTYIGTVHRRGYRLLVDARPALSDAGTTGNAPQQAPSIVPMPRHRPSSAPGDNKVLREENIRLRQLVAELSLERLRLQRMLGGEQRPR